MVSESDTGEGHSNMEREQITLRLPVALKEKIQREADEAGISFNAMVVILLQLAVR